MHTAKAKGFVTVAVSVARTTSVSKRGILSERISGGTVATVFGCTGFLGRYVVNRFGRMGAQVAVPFRGNEKDINHLKVMGDVGQIVPLAFSIRNPETVAISVSKSNTVVNCLGKHWATRNFTLREANVDSARVIAQASKDAGVKKFIHISCVGVAEDHPSEYLRTKWEAEQVVRSILPDATIIRATQLFGMEDKLLNKFGYIARWLPVFPFPLNGDAYIQPVSVRDVATAIMEVVTDKHQTGKTFELGGPDVFTLREFLDHIVLDTTHRRNRPVIQLPHAISPLFARICQQVRSPIYHEDEVYYYERDNIVQEGALSWAELGLPAPQSLEKAAPHILRMFAQPARSAY